MSPQTIHIKPAPTYVGKLSDGKRVYIKPCKTHYRSGGYPGARLAFAVYAEIERNFPRGTTRMELVERITDAEHGPDRVWNGDHWEARKPGDPLLSAREMAEQRAAWWKQFGKNRINAGGATPRDARVEIVELKPVGAK